MKTLGVLFTVVAAALASPASNPLGKEGDVLSKRQTTYTPGIDITAAGPLPAWSSINAKFVGIQTTSGTCSFRLDASPCNYELTLSFSSCNKPILELSAEQ